jgi:hypothetical protein
MAIVVFVVIIVISFAVAFKGQAIRLTCPVGPSCRLSTGSDTRPSTSES